MSAGKFRLKSRGDILKLGKTPNVHQVSLRSGNSWQAVSKYLSESEDKREGMYSVDLSILYGILTSGLGLTDEQALNLRIGDVFEVSKSSAAE